MKNRFLVLIWITCLSTVACLAADKMANYTSAEKSKKFTLVIDAGHGGHDAGACGAVSKEKKLTLKFALAFGRMVEQNSPDVRVVYTRTTDRFVELYRRAEIANNAKADLFISVHINALPRGHVARGFQTYTLGTSKRTGKRNGVIENLEVAKRENAVILIEKDYKQRYQGFDPNSPESNIMFEFIQDKNMEKSVELAKYMQRRVCAATGRQDMGAHQDNLAVLRLTSMPGCLIELGFISTRDEEEFMNSDAATERYARGIYQAFLDYKRRYDTNISIPYKAEPQAEVSIPTVVPKDEAKGDKKKDKRKKGKDAIMDQAPADTIPTAASLPPAVQQPAPVVGQPADTLSRQQATPPEAPVFKVQIFASSSKVGRSSAQLKDLKDVSFYEEGGLYKYTIGASTDYNEICQLRKSVLTQFPQCFIIAFKNGQKTDVRKAIQEFKTNKNNK